MPFGNAPTETVRKDPLTGFRFDLTDLSYIDHRLALHLSVKRFAENEHPLCVLRVRNNSRLPVGEGTRYRSGR